MSRYATMEPTITSTPRASEAGHFYRRDGTPVYEVPKADGKGTCEPDIRHARKLGLVPGVTSITRCAAAPGLVQWQVYQGILAAVEEAPRRPHEPEQEYLRRVYDKSQEKAKLAAEAGTAIHAAVEIFYRFDGRAIHEDYAAHVFGAKAELEKYFGRAEWATEVSFADPMGYGSKIDLYGNSGAIIVDTKTKDMGPDDVPTKENRKRLHYDEHAMQLAAYRYAKGHEGTICANLFVSRTVPGLCHLHVWEKEEIDRGFEMFRYLLGYWKIKNKFDSGWTA